MSRPILVCALLLMTSAAVGAQQASESSPYQGTSNPPPDSTIETTSTPQAKPPAGRQATPGQNQARVQPQNQPSVHAQSAYADPAVSDPDPDNTIVGVPYSASSQRPPAGLDPAPLRWRSRRRHCASASAAPRRTSGGDYHPRPPARSAFVSEQREGRGLSQSRGLRCGAGRTSTDSRRSGD